MTKYVKNEGGTVHSVNDDFELDDDHKADGWEEVTEADAPAALLGTEADPAVAAVELKDGPPVVRDTSGEPDEPGDKPEPVETPAETATEVPA